LTVGQLMNQLQEFPEDALVVVPDAEAEGFYSAVTTGLATGPRVVYSGDNGFDPSRSKSAKQTVVLTTK